MSFHSDIKQMLRNIVSNAPGLGWSATAVRYALDQLLVDEYHANRITGMFSCTQLSPVSFELKFATLDDALVHSEVVSFFYLAKTGQSSSDATDDTDAYDRAMRGI